MVIPYHHNQIIFKTSFTSPSQILMKFGTHKEQQILSKYIYLLLKYNPEISQKSGENEHLSDVQTSAEYLQIMIRRQNKFHSAAFCMKFIMICTIIMVVNKIR